MNRRTRRGKATHTLVENYLKRRNTINSRCIASGLFALLKPYLAQIDNIHCLETIMYSKNLTIARSS